MATDANIKIGVDSSGVRAATEDLKKFAGAGDKAEKSTKDIEKALFQANLKAQLAGEAIGSAISDIGRFAVSAVQSIDRAIKSVGDFQDLADKTGASASGLAALKQSADVAGVSIEAVAQSTVALSLRLSKVDDDSKGAGKALKAIGIEVEAFKQLKPDEQYRQIAVALDRYADSGKKTALVTELLGKSGAEQLKVLKEVAQQGEQNNILTDEQIALADDYSDSSARLQSQLQRLGQVASLQAAPAFIAFKGALFDAASEILGVSNKSTDLSKNQGIQDFAKAAVRSLASVIDFGQFVAAQFEKVGQTIGGVAAAIATAAGGEVKQAFAILDEIKRRNQEIDARTKFSTFVENRLNNPDRPAVAGPKEDLNFSNVKTPKAKKPGAGGADRTQADELRADLDGIKQALSAQTSAYKNSESILDALRSAGLVREGDYYEQKRKFIELDAQAQVAALEKENAALGRKLGGKEEEVAKRREQIAENSAKIAIIQADAQAKLTVSTINQQASLDALALSYRQAEAAASEYLQTLGLQGQRSVAAVGQSNRQRQEAEGRNAIEDRFTQQRNQLESERRQGAFKDNEAGYQQQLALLRRTKDAEIAIYEKTNSAILDAQGDFSNGVRRSLQEYADSASNVADSVGEVTTRAFKGAEDALVDFVKTGKLSFGDLIDSILSDLIRLSVQQAITKPLAESLLGSSSGGSGKGDFLTGLITAGIGAFGGGGGTYNGSTGGINGGSAILPNSLRGGGLADGGPAYPGSLQPINERGPEILTVGSKSYLTMGAEGGRVTPMGGGSGARPVNVTNNFTVSGSMDRRSQDQIAAAAGAGTQRALARNT